MEDSNPLQGSFYIAYWRCCRQVQVWRVHRAGEKYLAKLPLVG